MLTMQVSCQTIAALTLPTKHATPAVPITTGAICSINLVDFQTSLQQSSLFTSPSQTADGFAEQLRDVVTELDNIPSLSIKTNHRRPRLRNGNDDASNPRGSQPGWSRIVSPTGNPVVKPTDSSRTLEEISCGIKSRNKLIRSFDIGL